MQRPHHQNIQNFKAELEARDICMKSIYALRSLANAVQSGDEEALKIAMSMAKMVLNELDHSTRR
jgi:hypothetical protein